MNPTIWGVIGPGFLNQVPALNPKVQISCVVPKPEGVRPWLVPYYKA